MINFFGNPNSKIFAVQTTEELSKEDKNKLTWLFSCSELVSKETNKLVASIHDFFIGPRSAMITPWSTNAVEITQNMGIKGIIRIEEFNQVHKDFSDYDAMIFQKFSGLDQNIFTIDIKPEPIYLIDDITSFNSKEGLALNEEEITYLEGVSKKINRKLTDSEVFGFSQVNSEHCRHKIFNGTFVIDGEEKPTSLFKMIKETSKQHPNDIVSAYKDNVAFIKGPSVEQFAPKRADIPDYYKTEKFDSVISLKAETHNFPTTVEPFNGAATGSGGEIRDRLAGGKGSLPLAGTAVYMTSYSRLNENRPWELGFKEREWLYQTPMDILIKASNGASDFGNKFGQPLICGSVLTFEHKEEAQRLGFDKVIMQAGGIGYGKAEQALKDTPKKEDKKSETDSTKTTSVTADIEVPKTIEVTAWYTPQIPVNQGPGEFWGLPGLILEINADQTTVLCSKIIINPEQKSIISAPEKGRVISRKEYNATVKQKMKEMREMYRGRGKNKRK